MNTANSNVTSLSAARLPSYSEVLDLALVKGWVEFERDPKTGQRTENISAVHHAAILAFLHALKQKPVPAVLLNGAHRHASSSADSKVIVRRFAEGTSGLPSADGKTKVPKKEVRIVQLSEF